MFVSLEARFLSTYYMTTEKATVMQPQKRKMIWYGWRVDFMWPRPYVRRLPSCNSLVRKELAKFKAIAVHISPC